MKKVRLSEKFEVVIASLPDRENLVSEIYYCDIQWIEISQETEDVRIQFYPHPYKDCWEFNVDEAILAIKLAKAKLLEEPLEDIQLS